MENMREKYQTLQLVQLKELAKHRGLKGCSAMRKSEVIEAMLAEDARLERLEKEKAAKEAAAKEAAAKEAAAKEAAAKEKAAQTPAARAQAASTRRPVRPAGSESTAQPAQKTPEKAQAVPVREAVAPAPAQAPAPAPVPVPEAQEPAQPKSRTQEVYDINTYPKE